MAAAVVVSVDVLLVLIDNVAAVFVVMLAVVLVVVSNLIGINYDLYYCYLYS